MTREYSPGQPAPWDVSTGEVPPGARNALVADGIDPDNPGAVLTFYTSGVYADEGAQPLWLPDWIAANVALKRLP